MDISNIQVIGSDQTICVEADRGQLSSTMIVYHPKIQSTFEQNKNNGFEICWDDTSGHHSTQGWNFFGANSDDSLSFGLPGDV